MPTLTAPAQTLEVTNCCVCGVNFAVPEIIMDERRRNAGNVYCPNGHCIGWKETEAERLKREVDSLNQANDYLRRQKESVEAVLETVKRSSAAVQGQLTKERKRVGNGVCPCCNRTFQNVQRHMTTQHPDFKDSTVDA